MTQRMMNDKITSIAYIMMIILVINVTPLFAQNIDSAAWMKNCVMNYKVENIPSAIKRELHRVYGGRFSMANPSERFQSTDVIEAKLKERRLVFSAECLGRYILVYEHGGYGYHRHLIFFDEKNKKYTLLKNTKTKTTNLLSEALRFSNQAKAELDHF